MTLDERNKIHAAIEQELESTDLEYEVGGAYNDFEPIDCGDSWEVQIRVKIKKGSI